MSDHHPFFLSQNSGFSAIDASAELLHPQSFVGLDADSATETQYFGFSVAEQRIHGIGYLWHHPNLRTVSGGIAVWQGIKPNLIHAELCDVRSFVRDTALHNDLHDYRLDHGYGVKVVEPLRRHHLTYADTARNNHVDLHFEAVQAPVMFGDGNHFEQAMRVRGELVLRGQQHTVDCYTVRDRSWGKSRPEDNLQMPPMSWLAGVFRDDFAFNLGIFDQVEGNPELRAPFVLPQDRTVTGGWIHRDGKAGRIVRARKRVVRASTSLLPMALDFSATDEFGRSIEVRGTLLAANTWQIWGSINFVICLMRWECECLVAYGDCQEGVWTDYAQHYGARR